MSAAFATRILLALCCLLVLATAARRRSGEYALLNFNFAGGEESRAR